MLNLRTDVLVLICWLSEGAGGAPVQAVALGAAVQAGILQGDVADVMVMDIWQASLMRAFAEQRLLDPPGAAGDADPEQAAEASVPEVEIGLAAGPVSGELNPEAAAREEEVWGPADLESLEALTVD